MTPQGILQLPAALEREFAQEKAAALGRLGRALEQALAALSEVDATGNYREHLLNEASLALWHFVVQREVCGLRDFTCVLRNYRVPREVAARMGAIPPRFTGQPHKP
jgi:hypothetical protein